MRVRKKPDLRINIPNYPADYIEMPSSSYHNDYVEMPPETRRLILEANRTPNDLQYIDDEPDPSNIDVEVSPTEVKFQVGVGSQTSVKFQDDMRSPTPEIRFTDPEGNTEVKKSHLEVKEVQTEDSLVTYRPRLQSLSAPVLGQHAIEALRMAYGERERVSGLI